MYKVKEQFFMHEPGALIESGDFPSSKEDLLEDIYVRLGVLELVSEEIFPAEGEMYFRISGDGGVTPKKFKNDTKDKISALRGEVFRTHEEATKYLKVFLETDV